MFDEACGRTTAQSYGCCTVSPDPNLSSCFKYWYSRNEGRLFAIEILSLERSKVYPRVACANEDVQVANASGDTLRKSGTFHSVLDPLHGDVPNKKLSIRRGVVDSRPAHPGQHTTLPKSVLRTVMGPPAPPPPRNGRKICQRPKTQQT